jgi:hypothetical protein
MVRCERSVKVPCYSLKLSQHNPTNSVLMMCPELFVIAPFYLALIETALLPPALPD